MRRLPFAVALLFIAGVAHAQNLGPVDWIFLVDTSRSMRGGAPESKDIWADVKLSIDSFAREASAADTVAIYAFDSDVKRLDVESPAFVSRALLPLEADGERTYLGKAIRTGLEHANALRAHGEAHRRQAVVLFTDGKDNPPDIDDPIPIEANVSRVGDTLVFFVSMGDHEPRLDAFAAATKGTSVLKAPTPEAIRTVSRAIRAKIPTPPPPPPVVKTQPQPAAPPPPPPSSPWPKVLAALALLAAVAVALLLQRRKQNRLEGELEILRPRTAPDAAFVGLPKLQASEVALSALLPADALAGSDARLFVRRRGGKKKVWIAASGGPLRINDVETPLTELYDADTIEIGGARLRFNRVGDERPEIHQEGEL
jgi:uncharacterized protein YegL